MASMVLSTVGYAVGSAFGGPIGGMLGRAVGGFMGSRLDGALFGGGGGSGSGGNARHSEGPRLSELSVMSSTQGAPIPRLYGRGRMSGQVIWATKLEEVISERTSGQQGGKGGGAQQAGGGSETTYSYFANFAVGICEGETSILARVWANGKPFDLSDVTMRFYKGAEDQSPDPLILAKEGANNAPAYRGLSYVVFERLPLAAFGNRLPQLSFEIIRGVGKLERALRSVVIIPGSTEFGYEPAVLTQNLNFGRTKPETRHTFQVGSNWKVSLDELQALCPNLESVSLVASMFGTDLRLAHCEIMPMVENKEKRINGAEWRVGNETRASARLVSYYDNQAAYGGTPSDVSLLNAIADLKSRGLKITFYPFIMMDIPHGNPMNQPPYPWRGTITSDQDNTPALTTAMVSFFGQAQPSHFSAANQRITYSGPQENSFRKHILHYAKLCQAAGGVDGFIVGSEMIGVSRLRSSSGVYPFVDEMVTLAADVKTLLPNTTLVYAADWTEYGAHVLNNAQEIRFPLDKLYASPAIGAIGIDYYAPLSDWRDGEHLDKPLGGSILNRDYLKNQLSAGEAYDYYYATPQDRTAQLRSPITDGAYHKPWIYRQKDLKNFWQNPHIERVGGIETTQTAWIPQSKPFWITEFGTPAADKGTNQPSVFPDPKSSTAGIPYHSTGRRDDSVQRAGLLAFNENFDPALGANNVINPISPLYNARMVDPANISIWAWDARPFPAFPLATPVWSDGSNWLSGHWLNGRLGGLPLADAVETLLAEYGVACAHADLLDGVVDGLVLERPMSARAILEPLMRTFGFSAHEEACCLIFKPQGYTPIQTITDYVVHGDAQPVKMVRAQENELPIEVTLIFQETLKDYQIAAVHARKLSGLSRKVSRAELAVSASIEEMEKRAELLLHDVWAGRDEVTFSLPPSHMALEVGDVLTLEVENRLKTVRIRAIKDGAHRVIEAVSVESEPQTLPPRSLNANTAPTPEIAGAPLIYTFEVPSLNANQPSTLNYIAVYASPWPRGYVLSSSSDGASFTPVRNVNVPSIIGHTTTALAPAKPWHWQKGVSLTVQLTNGAVSSKSEMDVFSGQNAIAVKNVNDTWEVLQFQYAELVGDKTYKLSNLLRGQSGAEALIAPIHADSPIIVLDTHIIPLSTSMNDLNQPKQWRLTPQGKDSADPASLAFTSTANTTALLPLAPIHAKAKREAGGIRLSWIRRNRYEGDSWELLEVPLNEQAESYEIDILSNSIVLRTLTASAQETLYSDEITDFGTPQSTLTFAVYQLSATVGRGHPLHAAINL